MADKLGKLPVIFRAERSGQFAGTVTAVFPTEPWNGAGDFTCYAHIGQHGGCSQAWYRSTRAATPAEFAPLLDELRAIYEAAPDAVELVPCLRMTPKHRAAFLANWR